MANRTVKVEGLQELEAALADLPKATGKAVLRRVARQALVPFDAAWRRNANAHRLTGSLEESGGIGTKLTKRQARLNKKREGKASIEMHAGPNDPAAIPSEYGTVDQPARAFGRPAWATTQDEVLDIVKAELGQAIAAAASRIARKNAKLPAKG
ncbi:hypothetical protein U1701_13145 [Sphingomonas sp. PB2P19]|uniref:hypothetical protein n=1 Tax=Sphingomonas rhamnosi TaxID=3096156 RepID=UPI002FC9E10B